MLFFKRILKKEEPAKEAAREERRGGQRYAVNPKFPLKAVLSFNGRDEEGNLLSSQRARWDWKGSLFNFSERGARMQMAPAVLLAANGDACDLKLRLEGFDLVVPCHITNIEKQSECIFFGLKHQITEKVTRSDYRQLLEIVALGATLKLLFKKPQPDDSGYLAEQYASDLPSSLSVWRHPADKAVAAFAFLLKDCLVRTSEGHPMEYLLGADAAEARPVSAAKSKEIQRLFRWVVPNLAPVVPTDVREFLQAYAT